MFGNKKSKKTHGFEVKRTRQENEREYADHAMQLGHKTRIVTQLNEEIDQHTRRMVNLHEEAKTLPAEQVPAPQTPTSEAPQTGKSA